MYGIIKQSGGHIGVYSVPGQGAAFKVYLPRHDQPAVVASGGAPEPEALHSGTLLIVEDEAELRGLAALVLRRKGYYVLEAGNGVEALEQLAQHEGGVNLMITDMVMPGMSGRDLAERVRTLDPHIQVLFISGYTDAAITQQGVLRLGGAFLQKPFTPASLARKVHEVLREPQPSPA